MMMQRYELTSRRVGSSDPLEQATLVGFVKVERGNGADYRHVYLASDVDAKFKEYDDDNLALSQSVVKLGARIAELEKVVSAIPAYLLDPADEFYCAALAEAHSLMERDEMTELTINVGPQLWEWHSFDNWCDTAARTFRFYQVRGCDVVCIDTKGRICGVGKHFMTARDDGAFPVKVYAVESTQGKRDE